MWPTGKEAPQGGSCSLSVAFAGLGSGERSPHTPTCTGGREWAAVRPPAWHPTPRRGGGVVPRRPHTPRFRHSPASDSASQPSMVSVLTASPRQAVTGRKAVVAVTTFPLPQSPPPLRGVGGAEKPTLQTPTGTARRDLAAPCRHPAANTPSFASPSASSGAPLSRLW